MSNEIHKPTEPTFYRAYGPGVIHEGITDPGLVTTTGQPSFVYSADAGEFAGMVADSDSLVEPMPATGVEVTRGTVYDFNGTAYVCVQSHTRTEHDPSIIPALFTPARAQAAPWVQPTGAQDAYAIGDRVTHDNPNDGGNLWLYESAINANTTQPGRDGTFDRWWTPIALYAEVEPGPEPEPEPEPEPTWVDTGVTVTQLVAAGIYRVSGIPTLAFDQPIRLGDAETVFKGYWPTVGTPSDYLQIAPHVTASVGSKLWIWE